MKYTKSNNNQFITGLKLTVENYFSHKKINKYGNLAIAIKGIIVLLIYALAYASIFRPGASTASLVTAYIVMGISGVMIVFNLVHDASHHAISKTKWINKTVCYLGDLVGINTYIWNIRHNIQHHTFTNVLAVILSLKTSPHQAQSPPGAKKIS
ncbi:MAG: fatty acid desaturase [Bacteroidota bacterium]